MVTTTLTVPAVWPGATAVMEVPETTVTPVAAVPPKDTESPEENPVPEMVTEVVPPIGPLFGTTPVTVGMP